MEKKVTIPLCFILVTAFISQCNAKCIELEHTKTEIEAFKAKRTNIAELARTQEAAREGRETKKDCEPKPKILGPFDVTDIREIDGKQRLCNAQVSIHLCAGDCPAYSYDLYFLVLNLKYCECCKALTKKKVTVEWSCIVPTSCNPTNSEPDEETYEIPAECGCGQCP